MQLEAADIVTEYAKAVGAGSAAVFIGAGLSVRAGFPNWTGLIGPASLLANVPDEVKDEPLRAEYIIDEQNREWLNNEMLKELDVDAIPSEAHLVLGRIPINEYWTTNYDSLMEQTLDVLKRPYKRIVRDNDYTSEDGPAGQKRLTKMHGSLAPQIKGKKIFWESNPVISRSDFEGYEVDHPLIWAQLRAQYLTSSFLFLGLSFDDPNLGVLLRLARSLPSGMATPSHFAVLKDKAGPTASRLQALRIADLEKSGIQVHLVNKHEDLDDILARLEVRCREANLFVAGGSLDSKALQVMDAVGTNLASVDRRLALLSFGGDAALAVGREFRAAMQSDEYRPERIKFYFRKSLMSLEIKHRVGMAVFTDLDLPEMREEVLPTIRCMIVAGGGARTAEEVHLALDRGASIVPIAATGGTAEEVWKNYTPEELRLAGPDVERLWSRLNGRQSANIADAAVKLVNQSMFG